MNAAENFFSNVTLIDVQLASAYYPLLVDVARTRSRVTYGDLVERAKAAYPGNPVVQRAIAVSTGRRLDVVRQFTRARALPDLTSLVINAGKGECGVGFTRSFDPVAAREEVFAFDWSAVVPEFQGFVKDVERATQPRKRVKEKVALEIMASHYKGHKAQYPASVREHRELIIELIMEGFPVEQAFAQALALKTAVSD